MGGYVWISYGEFNSQSKFFIFIFLLLVELKTRFIVISSFRVEIF